MLKRLFTLAVALICICGVISAHAASESPLYTIEVDMTNQITTVYRVADRAIVRQMICSTGTGNNTPLGTFRLEQPRPSGDREPWYYIPKYRCYVKYATRIKGPILFHSIPYADKDMSTIDQEALAQLGTKASHGCIRLRWEDAEWIAEFCPQGTVVRIFNGAARKEALRQVLLNEGYELSAGLTYGEFIEAARTDDNAFAIGRGASGEEVSQLQRRLIGLGFMSGEISGVYDEATVVAVMRYQAASGLTVSGVTTRSLSERIIAENSTAAEFATLSPGSVGTLVAKFQEALRELGFYTGEIDGVYGEALAEATANLCACLRLAPSQDITPDIRSAAYRLIDALKQQFGDEPFQLYYTKAGNSASVRRETPLYARASVSQGALTILPAGATVRLISRSGRWREVEYGGWRGYVPAGRLTDIAESEPAAHWGRSIDALGKTEMKPGDLGDGVLALNQRLAALGFYSGDDAALYSLATARAVEAYQLAAGLEDNGLASPALQRKIASDDEITGIEVVLERGSNGPAVAATQRLLRALQYYDGDCDGHYSRNTAEAVRRFTLANGLPESSVATPDVQTALYDQYFDCEERYGSGNYTLAYTAEDGRAVFARSAAPIADALYNETSNEGEQTLLSGTILEACDPVAESPDDTEGEIALLLDDPRPAWMRSRPPAL